MNDLFLYSKVEIREKDKNTEREKERQRKKQRDRVLSLLFIEKKVKPGIRLASTATIPYVWFLDLIFVR